MKINQLENGSTIISPELPPCFDGDMEWDLQDVMFMLEMEGAKRVFDITFSYYGKTYNISECECRELSKGQSVCIEAVN